MSAPATATDVTAHPDFPVRVTPPTGGPQLFRAAEVLARPAVAEAIYGGMLGGGVARPGLRPQAEVTVGWVPGYGFEDMRRAVLDLASRLASPGRVAVWEWPVTTTEFRWWLVPIAENAEDASA